MAIKYQKRHYEDMADILRTMRGQVWNFPNRSPDQMLDVFESELCVLFSRDNPRFQVAKFVKACKPAGE